MENNNEERINVENDEKQALLELSTTKKGLESYTETDSPPEPPPAKDESKTKVKYTRTQWLTLFTLAFGNFAIGCCSSLQAPFFPQEAEKKGATPTEYGLVFGVYYLAMFLSAPIYGKLIVKMPPKFMINSGMVLMGGSTILFGILDRCPPGAPYLTFAFLTRIVEGIGSAAVKTATASIISYCFSDSIASTFSYLETFRGIGVILGPTIGGVLYDLSGFELPFLVAGTLSLIDVVVIYFVLPETKSKAKEKSGNYLKFICHLGTLLDASFIFMSYICLGFQHATLEPHLRQFNLSGAATGGMFVITGALYAFCTPIWGKICDRGVHPRILNLIGGVMMFFCWFLIGPAPFLPFDTELWVVIIALTLLGSSFGGTQVSAFYGSLRTAMERGFPDNLSTYGLAAALFASASSFGSFLGPTLGGILLENLGYRPGTLVLMMVVAIAILAGTAEFLYKKWETSRRKPHRPTLARQASVSAMSQTT